MAASNASKDAELIPVFSYGSNSIAQLQRRCHNPSLRGQPARLDRYSRIFAGKSMHWGGAVASIAIDSASIVFGSLTYLSPMEIDYLDCYEGGYSKHSVDVKVIMNGSWCTETVVAIAYIKDDTTWTCGPSDAYLTAIHVMLREQFDVEVCKPLPIKKIDEGSSELITVSEWVQPDCTDLSISAICVEVNSRLPAALKWEMPIEMFEITKKLSSLGINSTREVILALRHDRFGEEASLNARLRSAGCTRLFNTNDLCIIRELLQCPINPELESASELSDGIISHSSTNFDAYPRKIFVYGTLMRGMGNHHLMEGSRFLSIARTKDRFAMFAAGVPFVNPDEALSTIFGELFEVPTVEILDKLDRLEGHPDWYIRTPCTIEVADVEQEPSSKDSSIESTTSSGTDGLCKSRVTVVEAEIYFNRFMTSHSARDGDCVVIPTGNFHDAKKFGNPGS